MPRSPKTDPKPSKKSKALKNQPASRKGGVPPKPNALKFWMKEHKTGVITTVALCVILLLFLAVLDLSRPHVEGDKLRFDTFLEHLENGQILDARVLDVDSFIVGSYTTIPQTEAAAEAEADTQPAEGQPTDADLGEESGDLGVIRKYNAPLIESSEGSMLTALLSARIPIVIDQQIKKRVAQAAVVVLPGLALIIIFAYIIISFRRRSGIFSVRSGARKIAAEEDGLSFKDVAGQQQAITELREIKDFLADPDRFVELGARVPRGVLLYGPPGVGKTMLARALANEAGAAFYSISGSDFIELYVGVGAARVRDLFKEAREYAPSVIFIDELDSVGRSRGTSTTGMHHSEQEQTLNQILAEMDGFSPSEGIIVLAATNRPDVLDPALLRPGRFDRTIALALPDAESRLEILQVHAKDKKLAEDVDLASLSQRSTGLSGADLANLLNEGALLAGRGNKPAVEQQDLDDSLQRTLEAPERQRRLSLRNRGVGKRYTDGDKITFADVAGQDHAIIELKEVKDYLSNPERFAKLGAIAPKGILLYGPPGCGKTMLAKALAAETNAAFFSLSGSEFVEIFVGRGASRVREVFADARAASPAIIFIDEIDSIGRARGTNFLEPTSSEQDQALNQILAEMDGFSNKDGVLVVAATNRANVLDQALLRPGRFDRTIGLALPDEPARLQILKIHAKDRVLGPDTDLAAIANQAIGLSGADLASIVNEGAMIATRTDKAVVEQEDLVLALKNVLEAPDRHTLLSMRARSIGRRFTGKNRVTFENVVGQKDAIEDIRQVQDFLLNPEKFAKLGAKAPRGILLYGPPGCGKTLMARALAGETNAAFFSVSASEFVEVWVGRGAARVREIFASARSMTPAIIFIDEIDAIGRSRGGTISATNGEQEQALNQILTEMDGFSPADGVVVIGATNRPDIIDSALLRPGRFDRAIGMERPDEAARLEILKLHAVGKVFDASVDLKDIASRAIGLTGADLASVLNEGVLLAVRRNKDATSAEDLDDGLQRVLQAPEKQRRLSMRGDRSIGKRFTDRDRITFADIAGVDDAIKELIEVKQYLSEPEKFKKVGARAPRGILLHGPPGCGKTLLARAVAGEANAAFFSVAGTEFVEIFVGEGASRVREVFAEAKSMAPAIVFIDEIDAVGGHRTSVSFSGTREVEQTLNQLLIEMDGFESGDGVIVMAATNRPDRLDRALVRPGRFDRQVTVSLPDRPGRKAILDLYAKNRSFAPDVNLNTIAGLTRGASGADLANLMNEAALLSVRSGEETITMAILDQAIDRAILGVGSRTISLTDDERTNVAYHEAGHAVAALILPNSQAPHKVTILPKGVTLGHCAMIDSHDRLVQSRSRYIEEMAVALAGPIAEEMILGERGSGGAGDLHWANRTARRMTTELGMSEGLGWLAFAEDKNGKSNLSEGAAHAVDNEVRKILEEAASVAREALTPARDALVQVAEALLEKEVLTAPELIAAAGPLPAFRGMKPSMNGLDASAQPVEILTITKKGG